MSTPLRAVATFRESLCLSSKQADSVLQNIVRFTDGSVADLDRHEYHSKGPGHIAFVELPRSLTAWDRVTPAQTFSGQHRLHIECGHAHVHITEHDSPDAVVQAAGDEWFVNHLRIADHGAASLRLALPHTGEQATVVYRNGRQTEGPHIPGVVHCKVPSGALVAIVSRGHSRVWIDAALAACRVELSASGSIAVRETALFELQMSGSGRVLVGRCTSSTRLKVSGSGTVHIVSGDVEDLGINQSGSGTIAVGATAKRAAISQSGSGSLVVANVTEQRSIEAGGGGAVIALP